MNISYHNISDCEDSYFALDEQHHNDDDERHINEGSKKKFLTFLSKVTETFVLIAIA